MDFLQGVPSGCILLYAKKSGRATVLTVLITEMTKEEHQRTLWLKFKTLLHTDGFKRN